MEDQRKKDVKRLVIDARESGTSTGRYVDKLIEHLAKLTPGFEIIILTKSPRLKYMQTIAPNFKVVAADFKEFTFDEQLGFKKVLHGLQADLVHFSMPQQPILYRGRVLTTIQDLTTVRFTNPNKNWFIFKAKQQVYKYVMKRVARKSAGLIAISEYVKKDIVDYARISPDKVTVTLEAAEPITEAAEPIQGFEGKDFIMFNGRPLPHKNLNRLIEAFARLHAKYPDLLLMIAGKKDRSHASYQALTARLGVADKVILTDWITDGQLKWAMQNTKAYVYPSLSEGFGLPPLEAMLNDAPVVASNATCLPEVLGDAVRYFNPLDVDDMAGAIDEVLSNEKLQKELIDRGHGQVRKYSWQRMAKQTLATYEQLLNDS